MSVFDVGSQLQNYLLALKLWHLKGSLTTLKLMTCSEIYSSKINLGLQLSVHYFQNSTSIRENL